MAAARPRALFLVFLSIALSGFGGVLPFARRALVERRGWLTPDDFTETLSLCQSLPGPNVVNLSIVVGARACGWRGSLAAVAGLVGAPVLIVITLGVLYGRSAGWRRCSAHHRPGRRGRRPGRGHRRAHGRAAAASLAP